ncbi:KLHL29 [Branchiostoma lanceolatum]|uniref:KLHL29 protein n=1 Tax=Branchiostoma lanceolatum TaxID=7740 RepID=A0A8J9ZZX9_BRALA|nr:KLHL29 [Branchiostoma lanceolatum]
MGAGGSVAGRGKLGAVNFISKTRARLSKRRKGLQAASASKESTTSLPGVGEEEGIYCFRNHGQAIQIMEKMNELRKKGEFTDITLVQCKDSDFPCHRAVLMSAQYFRLMLEDLELGKAGANLSILHMHTEVLEDLLSFIYTGNILVTPANARHLLEAAHRFQMQDVAEKCCYLLEAMLTPANCLGLWQLADTLDQGSFLLRAQQYALHNFQQVMQHEEMLQLSSQQIVQYLSHDDLCTPDEHTVFTAAMKWLDTDTHRKACITKLVHSVRLEHVTPEFLVNSIETVPSIMDNPECAQYISDAKNYHLIRVVEKVEPKYKPRKSYTTGPSGKGTRGKQLWAQVKKMGGPKNNQSKGNTARQSVAEAGYQLCKPEQPSNVLKLMCQQRKDAEMTDITVCCEDSNFYCHKAVLATNAYFMAMFSADMRENQNSEAILKGVSPDIVSRLLNYIYTGEITMTTANAQDLLEASCHYQFQDVREACCTFLQDNLHPANCIGMWQFAEALACDRLQEAAKQYALRNFPDVCVESEILALPLDHMLEYLSSDKLFVMEEGTVFDTAMRWLNHDLANRRDAVRDMLGTVRLISVHPSYLQNVVSKNALIKQCPECMQLVEQAKKHVLLQDCDSEWVGRIQMSKPRDCVGRSVLVIVGGMVKVDRKEVSTDKLIYYDPQDPKWRLLGKLPVPLLSPGVAATRNSIYITGGKAMLSRTGEEDDTVTNKASMYSLAIERWLDLADMLDARRSHGCILLNGKVYVVGGLDQHDVVMDSAEVYDPEINQWESIMPLSRAVCAAATAACQGQLYVIGGSTMFNPIVPINLIQCFSPETGRWKYVESSLINHIGSPAVTMDGKIYAIAGAFHNHVIVFDPNTNQVTRVANISIVRALHSAAMLDGKIYCTGGIRDVPEVADPYNSMECYDPETDTWTAAGKLPQALFGHRCVTVFKRTKNEPRKKKKPAGKSDQVQLSSDHPARQFLQRRGTTILG